MSSRAAIWIAFFASLPLAITAAAQPAASEAPTEARSPAEAPSPTPSPTPAVTPAATPAATESAAVPTPPLEARGVLPSAKSRQGFDLLAMAGYGKSTDQAYGNDVEPYGPTFGLDSGYTWAFGLRLGVYLDYGLGRRLTQDRMPLIGRTNELSTDAWSLNTGLSLGHDLWLRFLILRYTWSFGATWYHWDFASDPPRPIRGFPEGKGSTVGFHTAPGLAVLWPLGHFTVGVGFEYFIQTKSQITSGILSKLLVGVKL